MGHEYVELKNPGAAIESYRRAVGTKQSREYESVYWQRFVNVSFYVLFCAARGTEFLLKHDLQAVLALFVT